MLWHLTAAFLYGEMFFVLLLMLPFISSRSWSRFFKFQWIQTLAANATFYFNLFLVILVLVLAEAFRNSWNQKEAYNSLKKHPYEMRPETESLYLMRMFRAQRNLHIAGFALYMWFVLQRLIRLISDHAQLSASQEASLKQAQSASAAARQMLDKQRQRSQDDDDDEAKSVMIAELKKQLKTLSEDLENEKAEHRLAIINLETLKKQSERLSAEYDDVTEKCQDLEKRLLIAEQNSPNRKDD